MANNIPSSYELPAGMQPMMASAIEASGTVVAALIARGKYNETDSGALGKSIAAVAASVIYHLTDDVKPS